MNHRRTFTQEQIDTLLAWIDTHPTHDGPIDLGHGIVVTDMDKLLTHMRPIIAERFTNPSFTGQIEIVSKLMNHLQEK